MNPHDHRSLASLATYYTQGSGANETLSDLYHKKTAEAKTALRARSGGGSVASDGDDVRTRAPSRSPPSGSALLVDDTSCLKLFSDSKVDEAQSCFEALLEQQERSGPGSVFHASAQYNLARVLNRNKQPGRAVMLLHEVLKVKGDNGDVFFQLGVAHRHLNDLEKSRQYYERALAVEPDFAVGPPPPRCYG